MPSKVKYFYELTVSSSPHVHGPNRTGRLMLDVILALLPALVGAVVSFGPRVCWCAACLWQPVYFLNGDTGRL